MVNIKEIFIAKATHIFEKSNIQITSAGQRHLGAVIGSREFKKSFCEKMVEQWIKEIKLLSDVALSACSWHASPLDISISLPTLFEPFKELKNIYNPSKKQFDTT